MRLQSAAGRGAILCVIVLVGVTLMRAVPAAWGQEPVETTVWLTILGEGGAEEVTIDPEGGLVPYWLFAETDPIGTPGNFGLRWVVITIDTDTGVAQQPATEMDPSFFFWPPAKPLGIPVDPDDVFWIGGGQYRPFRDVFVTGVGQSGPQGVAHGDLIIPAAAVGSEFHASILVDPEQELASVAVILGSPRFPVRLIGNTLTIRVVPDPSSGLLIVGGAGFLLCGTRRKRPLLSKIAKISAKGEQR